MLKHPSLPISLKIPKQIVLFALTLCGCQPNFLGNTPLPQVTASPQISTSPTPNSPNNTASPAASTTPTPSAPPFLSLDSLPKGNFKFKLDLKALSAEEQAQLGNAELTLSLRSEAMDGPPPSPVAVDIDNTDISKLPVSRTPRPIYDREFKLRAEEEISLSDVPLGIILNAFLSYRFPKPAPSQPPIPLCSKLNEVPEPTRYLSLAQSLTFSAQSPALTELQIKTTQIADHDLVAFEFTQITGQVRDSANQPLADATVAIKVLEYCQLETQVQTDAQGQYRFYPVPPGTRLEITVSKAGYVSQKRVEVPSSNKQGDPKLNRYDFGGPDSSSSALQKQ